MNTRSLLLTVLIISGNTACIVVAVNLKVQNQLHKAIFHDSTKEIRQAIKAGADVNYTKGGKSPLILAVLLKRTSAVQYLLANGAQADEKFIVYTLKVDRCYSGGQISIKAENGKTAYLLAKACGIDINTCFDVGFGQKKSLLQHALELGGLETVLALIKDGADYSILLGNGLNNIVYFCEPGNPHESLALDIVQELINNGYNVNNFWSDVYASYWRENILKLLIKNGANPNYVFKKNQNDDFTCTPLISAIGDSKLETVKFLLDAGSDINQKAGQVSTGLQAPLAYAIDHCYHIEIIELLIEHGANLEQ